MAETDKKPYEDVIEREFSFLLDHGFEYEYTYEKASDKTCVYIYRFFKRGAYFDLRTVSGGSQYFNCVVYTGEYRFPKPHLLHKKQFRAFKIKHLFKKPTDEEIICLYARLLKDDVKEGSFFGIPLS